MPLSRFGGVTADANVVVTALLLLLLVLSLFTGATVAQRCTLHCYRGSVQFENDTSVQYAFSFLPCDGDGNDSAVSSLARPLLALDTQFSGGDASIPSTSLLGWDVPYQFVCAVDAADDGSVFTLSVQNAQVRLRWRYITNDGEQASCAQVLQTLDTLAAQFVRTEHQLLEVPASAEVRLSGGGDDDTQRLETAQTMCGEHCAVQCFDTGVLQANGLAQEHSPCGAPESTTCAVRVRFSVDLCVNGVGELALQPVALDDIDVYLGTDQETRLSLYRPAALDNAELRCDTDGTLSLDATGISVQWEAPSAHAGDCFSMMHLPMLLASGSLSQLVLGFGSDELWTLTEQTQSTLVESDCGSVPIVPEPAVLPSPSPPPPAAGTDVVVVTPHTSNATENNVHPLEPHVTCSRRMRSRSPDLCCTLFGYRNRNAHEIHASAVRPFNYMTPEPVSRQQTTEFAANTTVPVSFAVLWVCERYERPSLRWTLNVDGARERQWHRAVQVSHVRNDCTDALYNAWCV